jgi:hypothetical protein
MRKWMILVACLAGTTSWQQTGLSQQSAPDTKSGPPLEETMEFLATFTQSQAGLLYFYVGSPDEFQWAKDEDAGPIRHTAHDGCRLELYAEFYQNAAKDPGVKIDLRQVDPLTLTATDTRVRMEYSGGRQDMEVVHIKWSDGKPVVKNTGVRRAAITLVVRGGREQTERLHRALKHAVELCGGKVSPF